MRLMLGSVEGRGLVYGRRRSLRWRRHWRRRDSGSYGRFRRALVAYEKYGDTRREYCSKNKHENWLLHRLSPMFNVHELNRVAGTAIG
jgi:hypothetical protein